MLHVSLETKQTGRKPLDCEGWQSYLPSAEIQLGLQQITTENNTLIFLVFLSSYTIEYLLHLELGSPLV